MALKQSPERRAVTLVRAANELLVESAERGKLT
jgi:hypothetical protein